MKRRFSLFPLFLLCSIAFSQRVLRNDDVVRMVRRGTPATEIVSTINASNTKFTMYDEDVRYLRKNGAQEIVIRAMFARQVGAKLQLSESPKTPQPSAVGAPVPLVKPTAPASVSSQPLPTGYAVPSTVSPYQVTGGAPPNAKCLTCERDAEGRIKRSEAAKHSFQKQHPCPATGSTTGSCPGYEIDHIVALSDGGADDPLNMQWLTADEHSRKHVARSTSAAGPSSPVAPQSSPATIRDNTVHTGPRGGRYTISPNGNKVYLPRK